VGKINIEISESILMAEPIKTTNTGMTSVPSTIIIQASKEKKPKPSLWTVQITRFEDDYKHRYDNGVYPDKPELFRSKPKAVEYLIRVVGKAILERINEYEDDLEEFANANDDDFKLDSDGLVIFKKKLTLQKLDTLHSRHLSGEFVCYQLEYEISETKIN
jgi:hypothetical protein